jgi:hypothetical protein
MTPRSVPGRQARNTSCVSQTANQGTGLSTRRLGRRVLNRTMGRHEHHRMALALPDGSLALRTEVPPLPAAAVRRAAPPVAEFHRDQLSSVNRSRFPTR